MQKVYTQQFYFQTLNNTNQLDKNIFIDQLTAVYAEHFNANCNPEINGLKLITWQTLSNLSNA